MDFYDRLCEIQRLEQLQRKDTEGAKEFITHLLTSKFLTGICKDDWVVDITGELDTTIHAIIQTDCDIGFCVKQLPFACDRCFLTQGTVIEWIHYNLGNKLFLTKRDGEDVVSINIKDLVEWSSNSPKAAQN